MAKNVRGGDLDRCSTDPMTGFYRDGCCNTSRNDLGQHVICVRVTADFLEYSASRGNDLSTPNPEFVFSGLNPGDQWCLCATRWREAMDAGVAPRVVLQATHAAALRTVKLRDLKQFAIDLV